MIRVFLVGLMALALAACSRSGEDLSEPAVPLGDFNLSHNVVVAPKVVKGPFSRNATEEELTTALRDAIAERFDRYEGDKLYHFGVSIEGYVLAAPGVPVVYSPRSVMIILITVWDDAAGGKLTEEPHQITVFESLSGETTLGSGLTQSKEEQLRNLTVNAAKQIELYLVRQREKEGWFGPDDGAVPSPETDAESEPEPAE